MLLTFQAQIPWVASPAGLLLWRASIRTILTKLRCQPVDCSAFGFAARLLINSTLHFSHPY
jgi:hypothetical protein